MSNSYRLTIACPFCLTELKRWKMFEVVWVKYPIVLYDKHGHIVFTIERKVHGFKLESDALKFEQKVLQEHLTSCCMKDIVSRVVLEHYKLTR